MLYINKKKQSNHSRRYPDEAFILVLPPFPPLRIIINMVIIIIIICSNYNINSFFLDFIFCHLFPLFVYFLTSLCRLCNWPYSCLA